MDTNFQTSFIPKKPLAEERVVVPTHTSLYSFIATLIFFAALAAAGGMYFYQASLTKSIATSEAQLVIARDSFEPTLITTLQTLGRRITDSSVLLKNHIAVSPIFAALSAGTLKSIQFTKFSYINPVDSTAPVMVTMSGKARDYQSIVLESDQLSVNKDIHNPLFSNLALDPVTGMVGFDLAFTVSPDLVRFQDHVDELQIQPAVIVPVATPESLPVTATPPTVTQPVIGQ